MISFFDYAKQRNIIEQKLNNRISNVMAHGKFILGPEVTELEEKLSNYTGAKFCITCANGTDALHIALLAAGVNPGDEVIVPSFTYIAPAEVISLIGANPVYVDVCPKTFNICTQKVKEKITKRTKAIVAVSLYGQPADFVEINGLAKKNNLTVIEDAAQSFGAEQFGKKSCNLSKIGCTSFFPSKPLGCYGDGGAVFTSDLKLANTMRCIARHGQEGRYNHISVGMNSRLDTVQAAILLCKLEILDDEIRARNDKAAYLTNGITSLKRPDIQVPHTESFNKSAWAQYTIRTKNRGKLISEFSKESLPYSIHYPKPIFFQPAYLENIKDCPNSIAVSKDVISLPVNAYIDEKELDLILEIINQS